MSITASEARQRLFPLMETVYLLQSPKNAERLRESMAQARSGEAQPHELIE